MYSTSIQQITFKEARSFGKFIIVGAVPANCCDESCNSKIYETEQAALDAILADGWIQANPQQVIQLANCAVYPRHGKRHVRKNSRPSGQKGSCHLCGAHRLIGDETHCKVAKCLYCETEQCFYNGGARGTCSICYVGLLPGWAGNDTTCRYAGCKSKAVAIGRGGKAYVCREHADRQNGKDYVEDRLSERDKAWERI